MNYPKGALSCHVVIIHSSCHTFPGVVLLTCLTGGLTSISSAYPMTHLYCNVLLGYCLYCFISFTYCFMYLAYLRSSVLELTILPSHKAFFHHVKLVSSYSFPNTQLFDPLGSLFHDISRKRALPLCCQLPNTSMIIPTSSPS